MKIYLDGSIPNDSFKYYNQVYTIQIKSMHNYLLLNSTFKNA